MFRHFTLFVTGGPAAVTNYAAPEPSCRIWKYAHTCEFVPLRAGKSGGPDLSQWAGTRGIWLRTNGVNTNGAAAKVMNFDRLGKKVHPSTFGKIRVG